MNPSQLENIKLRLAAVRGRPWTISKGKDGQLFVGPKADYASPRDLNFWYKVDSHVEFCDACYKRLNVGRANADAASSKVGYATSEVVGSAEALMCAECKAQVRAVAQLFLATFMAAAGDADECQWLAKAADDQEALITSLEGYMARCAKLEAELEVARSKLERAKRDESAATESLRQLKSSLATLRSLLGSD